MYYKPHTLQVKRNSEPELDEYGRPVEHSDSWETFGVGRCDESDIGEITDDNGVVYRPRYHVVIEGNNDLKIGDVFRALRKDGTIRGEGRVRNVKNLNYLKYSEIWV